MPHSKTPCLLDIDRYLECKSRVKEYKMLWGVAKYTPLRASTDSSEDEIKLDFDTDQTQSRRRNLALALAPWLANLAFFVISSTLLYKAHVLHEMNQNWSGPPITHEFSTCHCGYLLPFYLGYNSNI